MLPNQITALKADQKICPIRSKVQALIIPAEKSLLKPNEMAMELQTADMQVPCVESKCEWWRTDIGEKGACVVHLAQELKDLFIRPV